MIPLLLACRVPDATPVTPTADTAAPVHTADVRDDDADGLAVWQNDCDDADPGVHPGAQDPKGDGRDTDCDGTDGAALDVLDHVRFVVTGANESDDLGTSVACSSGPVGPYPSAVAIGATQTVPPYGTPDDQAGYALVLDGRANGTLLRTDANTRVVGTKLLDRVGHAVVFPGDVDGDGRGDFVVTGSGAYRPKNGSGAAWMMPIDHRRVVTVDEAPVWVVGTWGENLRGAAPLGDVDLDGRADLLLAEADPGSDYLPGVIRVFAASSLDAEVAQEDALLSVSGLDPVTPTGEEMVVGDLTGDGLPDLITGEFSYGASGRVLIAPGPVLAWTFDGGLVVQGVGDVFGFGVRVAPGTSSVSGSGWPSGT